MLEDLVTEANRQFAVCNACRYCEGYCAVFPAMERRPESEPADLALLANLCHDCQACFQACMYADPHEFAIDIPALLAEAREASWRRYARPRLLGPVFDRGLAAVVFATIAAAAVLLGVIAIDGSFSRLFRADGARGGFYRLLPSLFLTSAFLALAAIVVGAVGAGVVGFVREAGSGRGLLVAAVWRRALSDAGRLEYLRGAGGNCYVPDGEAPSSARRIAHLFVVYGFLGTLAATLVAGFDQHALHRAPPYAFDSLPVVLGLAGGVALAGGCAALVATRARRSRSAASRSRADLGSPAFLATLLAVAVTGLLLLAARSTAAMGTLLVVHLTTVAALFVTAPYGRFLHAAYRLAALLVNAAEASADRHIS